MSKVIDVETYQWIKEVKRVKGTTIPKGRALVVGELRKVITYCTDKATVGGTRDAAIFATLYSAGLRRAELINLQLSDINFITNEIKISGKGGKRRTTAVSEDSLDLIKSYLRVRGEKEGVLFSRCWKSGKIGDEMLSTQAIYAMVVNTTRELGFPKMSPHSYRRSFCTSLLENGTDLFTVSKLMGHASVETTKVYDKRSDSVKNAASRGLSF
jgi:site-specific recombinase XerD